MTSRATSSVEVVQRIARILTPVLRRVDKENSEIILEDDTFEWDWLGSRSWMWDERDVSSGVERWTREKKRGDGGSQGHFAMCGCGVLLRRIRILDLMRSFELAGRSILHRFAARSPSWPAASLVSAVLTMLLLTFYSSACHAERRQSATRPRRLRAKCAPSRAASRADWGFMAAGATD